jgi:hypothetical protein
VGKEILVIVKRGLNADISGRDKPPYKNADMRPWRKIKQEWTLPDAKVYDRSPRLISSLKSLLRLSLSLGKSSEQRI